MKTRVMTMGDVGDPDAPPGSRPWAVSMRGQLRSALCEAGWKSDHVKSLLELMVRHQGYRQLASAAGEPFPTYEAFCVEPHPYGLGYKVEDIDRIIGERRKAETARKRARVAAEQTTGEVLPAHRPAAPAAASSQFADLSQTERAKANGVSKRTQEKLDALARRSPELLAKVRAGEMTVHRACVEAGVVKVPTQLDLLRRAWKNATAKERRAFLQEIS